MDMLSLDGWCSLLSMNQRLHNTFVLELGGLGSQCILGLYMIAMVKLAVFSFESSVLMDLGQNLSVLNGLDSVVVVVLVNLPIKGRVDLLMLGPLHGLMDNSGLD